MEGFLYMYLILNISEPSASAMTELYVETLQK